MPSFFVVFAVEVFERFHHETFRLDEVVRSVDEVEQQITDASRVLYLVELAMLGYLPQRLPDLADDIIVFSLFSGWAVLPGGWRRRAGGS